MAAVAVMLLGLLAVIAQPEACEARECAEEGTR
jgi:hypothetical protein